MTFNQLVSIPLHSQRCSNLLYSDEDFPYSQESHDYFVVLLFLWFEVLLLEWFTNMDVDTWPGKVESLETFCIVSTTLSRPSSN